MVNELPSPTGRELEILKVLWDHGASSVRQVHLQMQANMIEPIAYNTVQTLLRIMQTKNLVDYAVEGRTFIYTARYSREESATRFLDRVFDGAATNLMMTLIRAEKIPAEELEKISAMIAAARADQTGANCD
ncbi:MAG: BlaI/MecI/CopY family transcriptional regulator [Zavarzinella sp.]